VANHQIVMDGPKDAVLQRLSAARTQGQGQGAAQAGAAPTEQGAAA